MVVVISDVFLKQIGSGNRINRPRRCTTVYLHGIFLMGQQLNRLEALLILLCMPYGTLDHIPCAPVRHCP